MQHFSWLLGIAAAITFGAEGHPAIAQEGLGGESARVATDSISEQERQHSPPQPKGLRNRRTAMTVWLGTAQHSRIPSRQRGASMYRSFYLLGIRNQWAVDTLRTGKLEYFFDIFPAAVTTDNPDYSLVLAPEGCPVGYICRAFQATPHTTYGFGVAPLGLAVRVFRTERAQLMAEMSAGGIWFTRPVPDPAATKFNFTASAGLSIEVKFSHHSAVRLGYLFHHTSNGNTGRVNPGLNSNMFSLGITKRRE